MADPTMRRRAAIGAVSGAAGTLALSGFRSAMRPLGLVFETAPHHVLARLAEVGLLPRLDPRTRQLVKVAVHVGYGTAAGTAAGVLRRRRSGLLTETAVGAALGVLVWGGGWSMWLPLLRIESAPWNWERPTVLMPVLDHAAYGAGWGATFWALRSTERTARSEGTSPPTGPFRYLSASAGGRGGRPRRGGTRGPGVRGRGARARFVQHRA